MNTQVDMPPGLTRRILASPPARVLPLGFVLLLMMGLNSDVMGSFAGEPVKAVKHIIALAIAGFAVYIGHAHFVERRPVSDLRLPHRRQVRPPIWKRVLTLEARVPNLQAQGLTRTGAAHGTAASA